MPLYHKNKFLLLFILFWLIWCSPSFAQVETLTDQEYRQEAQTYMTNPCFEEVGRVMIKAMGIEKQQLTGVEFLRVIISDKFEELEKGVIDTSLEKIEGMSKNERMVWYKVGTRVCVKAFKESMLDNEIFSDMTQSIKSLEPKNELDFSLNEKPSNSNKNISARAKQQAIKTCKESLQILGSKMSYGMLNACIEQELQAYQEFQRNYGE